MRSPELVAGRALATWNKPLLGLFSGLLLVGYAAAFNRAVLPLYIWTSSLLALFLLGLGIPYLNLRSKQITRRMPTEAVVGQVAQVEVTLTNNLWFPAFMVQLSDQASFSADSLVVLGTLSRIPAKGKVTFTSGIPCHKRGIWSVGPAFMVSSFPLDLVTVAFPCDDPPSTLTVFPRTAPVTSLFLAGSNLEQRQNELPAMRGRGDEQVKGLRDYRPGDLPKHIHWRASARHGELVVREFEPVTTARIRLLLNLDSYLDNGPAPQSAQELQVSIAASITLYAQRHGIPVCVGLGSAYPDLEVTNGDVHDTLSWFAGLPREAERSYANVLSEGAHATHRGESVFIFAADGDEALKMLPDLQEASTHVVLFLFELPGSNASRAAAALRSWSATRVIPVGLGQSLEEALNAASA